MNVFHEKIMKIDVIINCFRASAPPCLHTKTTISTIKDASRNLDIPAAACCFRADRHAAMTSLEETVSDEEILSRFVMLLAHIILTGLDRDTVIADRNPYAEKCDVLTALRIEAIRIWGI